MDDMSRGPDEAAPDEEAPQEAAPQDAAPHEAGPYEEAATTPEEPPGGATVYEAAVVVDSRQAHQAARRAGWAAHNWPWVLGLGIVAIVFGIVVLSHAFGSLSALLWLTGLFLLFMGVAQLMTLGRGGARGAHLVGAAITILGGIVLLAWPGETLKVVAVVAGLTFLLWGVVRVATALREERDDRSRDVLTGAALVVLGIIMMVWPSATITLVGIFVGLVAIAWGVLTVIGAFNLRKAGRHWEELHRASHRAG